MALTAWYWLYLTQYDVSGAYLLLSTIQMSGEESRWKGSGNAHQDRWLGELNEGETRSFGDYSRDHLACRNRRWWGTPPSSQGPEDPTGRSSRPQHCPGFETCLSVLHARLGWLLTAALYFYIRQWFPSVGYNMNLILCFAVMNVCLWKIQLLIIPLEFRVVRGSGGGGGRHHD